MATKVKTKTLNKEIGQALFSDTERMEMWFSAYWKRACIAALVFAVAVALGFWGVKSYRAAQRQAAYELADAVTIEELTRALSAHGDHPGAPMARLRLANILVDSEKYDSALREVKALLVSGNTDPAIIGKAKLLEAYICELTGKYAEAVKFFRAVGANAEFSPVIRAEANYSAARLMIKLNQLVPAQQLLKSASVAKAENPAAMYWTASSKRMLVALEAGDYGKLPAATK